MNLRKLVANDRWIPLTFCAGLAVVVAVNGAMVAVGLSTWPGVTAQNHYRKGLDYNRHLDVLKEERQLGWRAVSSLERAEGGAALAVEVADASGRPLAEAAVAARLLRPTHEGMDRTVALVGMGAGHWGALVEDLAAGQWDLEIDIRSGGQRYRTRERMYLPRQ